MKTVTGRGVVLLPAARMALGTHEIAVRIERGPMQHVGVLDLFIRMEMKPALATLVFRPAVPGDGKRLDPAIREFDQILLKGFDAEGVFHLESRKLAIGAIGLDEELVVLREEAGMDAVVIKTRVVEVAEHGGGRSVLHGKLVLGLLPKRGFGLMAIGAGFAADEGEGKGRARATRRLG